MNIKGYSTIINPRPQEPGEVWKDIVEFGNKYSVSTLGNVWSSASCRMLTQFEMQNGYVRVNFTHRSFSRLHLVHRLVAIAFIPNPENKPQVNHKDGDKSNCRKDNLEWATSAENNQHASKTGLAPVGESRLDSKLTEEDVVLILKDRYRNFMTEPELAKKYKVSRAAIRQVINGERWKHVECEERALIGTFKRISNKGKPHKKKQLCN